jgi:hypothetical protein
MLNLVRYYFNLSQVQPEFEGVVINLKISSPGSSRTSSVPLRA